MRSNFIIHNTKIKQFYFQLRRVRILRPLNFLAKHSTCRIPVTVSKRKEGMSVSFIFIISKINLPFIIIHIYITFIFGINIAIDMLDRYIHIKRIVG